MEQFEKLGWSREGVSAEDRASMFDSSVLYERWGVVIRMREQLHGGIPAKKELLRKWVESRTLDSGKIKADEQTDKQVAEEEARNEEAPAVPEEEDSWNRFHEDEKGLYIQTANVKALIRECLSVIGILQKKRGSKQILQHGLEVQPVGGRGSRLYLDRTAPDGREEKPIHVVGPQGPRNAIKRTDYVEGAQFGFEVWIKHTSPQETRHLGEAELKHALLLAQEDGLGADRSQGHGKFDVVWFEKIGTSDPAFHLKEAASKTKAKS